MRRSSRSDVLGQLTAVLDTLAFNGIEATPNVSRRRWVLHFCGCDIGVYRPFAANMTLSGQKMHCGSPAQMRRFLLAFLDSGQLYLPVAKKSKSSELHGITRIRVENKRRWLFFHRDVCICQYWPRMGYAKVAGDDVIPCATHKKAWLTAYEKAWGRRYVRKYR